MNFNENYKGVGSRYGKVQQTLICLGYTRSQNNCHSDVKMEPMNINSYCSFGLQFAFQHFVTPEDFLTNLDVKINMPCVRAKKCIIDRLLSTCKNDLSIYLQEEMLRKNISRECKSSSHDLQGSWNCGIQGMNGSDQSIIHNYDDLTACLWCLASKRVFNTFATVWCILLENCIGLQIFICCLNQLDGQQQ